MEEAKIMMRGVEESLGGKTDEEISEAVDKIFAGWHVEISEAAKRYSKVEGAMFLMVLR